jgi:hypothetical protein
MTEGAVCEVNIRGRRVAKQRGADWQLDLKPVTLQPTPAASFPTTENGAARHVEHARDDAALLKSLSAVTTAVTELHRAVEAIGQRLVALEGAVASQAAASQTLANQLTASRPATPPATPPPPAEPVAPPVESARATRPVRPTSRAIRDSSTAPLERRSRRAASPRAAEQDDAASQ